VTGDPDDFRMPILEHLRELRDRLVRALVALVLGCVAGLAVSTRMFEFLARPMRDALEATGKGTLAVTAATEGFFVQLKVAVFTGFLLALPVIAYQAWQFIAPALYDQERKHVAPLVAASTTLFLLGAAFAYEVVFRFGFPVFLEMNPDGVQAMLSIESYLSFATTLLVAFGTSFQLPVVIYFLSRVGLVNHRDLVKGFRYAIVIIFVIAAILTPPDVLSQFMMAIPLLVLYAIGIAVSYVVSTKPVGEAAAPVKSEPG
jgi:sec-independent protein translocase protein TatC